MRIGVLDSDGSFQNIFFKNKNIKVLNEKYKNEAVPDLLGLTHSEYVCSYIAKENPEAEIILLPIINRNKKCSVQTLIDGINLLVEYQVDVINMSIGDEYKYHKELECACKNAFVRGILLIAAYSNNNEVQCTYPASFPFVVGVKCENEKKPNHIIQYDKVSNDLIFSTSYFSLYHLGIPRLYQGNSFACAVVSGLLSHDIKSYQSFLIDFSESVFNQYYPYQTLKENKCCFLTNRIDEPLEKKFITEVTDSIICYTFTEGISKVIIPNEPPEDCQIVFIDHDDYRGICAYKEVIRDYVKLNNSTEVVLRYPLYSLSERFDLFVRNHRAIYQFYI